MRICSLSNWRPHRQICRVTTDSGTTVLCPCLNANLAAMLGFITPVFYSSSSFSLTRIIAEIYICSGSYLLCPFPWSCSRRIPCLTSSAVLAWRHFRTALLSWMCWMESTRFYCLLQPKIISWSAIILPTVFASELWTVEACLVMSGSGGPLSSNCNQRIEWSAEKIMRNSISWLWRFAVLACIQLLDFKVRARVCSTTRSNQVNMASLTPVRSNLMESLHVECSQLRPEQISQLYKQRVQRMRNGQTSKGNIADWRPCIGNVLIAFPCVLFFKHSFPDQDHISSDERKELWLVW